ILLKAAANRDQQTPQREVIGNVRMADRAEKDGIEGAQMLDSIFGHHAAGLDIASAAPVEMAPLELKSEPLSGCFQRADSFGNDLVADTVAGNHRDFVRFHRTAPGCGSASGLAKASSRRAGFNPRSSNASAAPSSVMAPRNANPAKKFPVFLLRYPTISGAKYAPRLPSAFTSPITDPTTLAGSVSVGIDQNGPRGP